MAPGRVSSTPASSQKKQQSISSFFSAKAANPTQSSPPSLPQTSSARSPPQAARDEDDSSLFVPSADEEEPIPVRSASRGSVKRSWDSSAYFANGDKENTQQSKKQKTLEGEPVVENALSPRKAQPTTPPLKRSTSKVTERTSKYLFAPPTADSANVDRDASDNNDDEETRKERQRMHQRFVKKLGRPESIAEIKKRNHIIDDAVPEDEEAADEDEDGEDEPGATAKPSSTFRKGGSAKKTPHKLTPMEKQFLDIKRKHMDTLLVVEVGYKFRFFGEDARHAAKELHIVCIPGKMRFDEHPSEAHLDRFASASIPTHRLHVHVKRLVSAGHKVGVVRQLETAALKAAGDNRNAPFTRQLTNLYTKGTYIDDIEGLDAPTAGPSGGAPATGHLLCITETNAKGWGTDEKVQIGIVAVQPATGDIIYDDFEDGFMRSEIETRFLHIAPCELLIVGELSKATEKLVKHLSGSKTNVFGDKARVERVEKPKTATAHSYSHIKAFYAGKGQSRATAKSTEAINDSEGSTVEKILDKVHKLSEHVSICLSYMIKHLTEYGLEHVFDLTKNFQSFSARSHMLLTGNTLNSLEVYRNQTDNTEKGSLFWVLDQTQTKFGQRLLRKWVGRPLLDRTKLEQRINAVEELKDSERSVAVEKLGNLLAKTKSDLEKSLIRIYYGKCSRPELLSVLQTLQRIATEYGHVRSASDAGFQSEMINEAIASLPKILDDVLSYLERINTQAAKEDDKYNFFLEEHETDAITRNKKGIELVETLLESHRAVAAEKLRKKSVEYVTVAGIDFLIEVDNSSLKHVPASWAKISGTKKVSRFHTPEVVRMIRDRDQHKESLAAACDAAFRALQAEIAAHYESFRDCIQSLATLDCLLSLAAVAGRSDYVKPTFTDEPELTIQGGRHPMVEQLLLTPYVPNDTSLSGQSTTALLITGPNMGGKSSYVRSVALIAIMAQIGSYVPASSARLGMLDAVLTRMGARDNMMAGESTFMVELGETAELLRAATPRSLVVLDELGRGTSTHDGVAIAGAVLDWLVHQTRALALFITHYQSLAALGDANGHGQALRNVHMRFTAGSDARGDETVTFLYEVGAGVAHRSYGLNVARLANVPRGVLDVARERSAQMEGAGRRAGVAGAARLLEGVVGGGRVEALEGFVDAVGRL